MRRDGARDGGGSALRYVMIAIRLTSAVVFVVFGIGKFTDHASELASFEGYGLPAPDAFVYAVGVLEVGGGVLLALGRLVRPAALVLAGDMVGAIVVSGIARGETVSLTLAPALLVAMILLMYLAPSRDPRARSQGAAAEAARRPARR
jgi:putative oxidoreductase